MQAESASMAGCSACGLSWRAGAGWFCCSGPAKGWRPTKPVCVCQSKPKLSSSARGCKWMDVQGDSRKGGGNCSPQWGGQRRSEAPRRRAPSNRRGSITVCGEECVCACQGTAVVAGKSNGEIYIGSQLAKGEKVGTGWRRCTMWGAGRKPKSKQQMHAQAGRRGVLHLLLPAWHLAGAKLLFSECRCMA